MIFESSELKPRGGCKRRKNIKARKPGTCYNETKCLGKIFKAIESFL